MSVPGGGLVCLLKARLPRSTRHDVELASKWIVSRMRHDVEQACVFHLTDHALAEVPYDLTAWRWSSVFSMFYQCVITRGGVRIRAATCGTRNHLMQDDRWSATSCGGLPGLPNSWADVEDVDFHGLMFFTRTNVILWGRVRLCDAPRCDALRLSYRTLFFSSSCRTDDLDGGIYHLMKHRCIPHLRQS